MSLKDLQSGNAYHSRYIASQHSKSHSQITKVIRDLDAKGLLISTLKTTYQCNQSKRIYPAYWCCEVDMQQVRAEIKPKPRYAPPKSKYKREKISIELRVMIYERDNHQCQACFSSYNLGIDHMLPVSRGGKNNPENLQTMCQSCNGKKGTKTMDEWLGGGK